MDKAESFEGGGGGMKGCSILAELLERRRDQPWGGNGPSPTSARGGLCGHAYPMEGTILSASGWEAPSTGWIKDVTNSGHQPLGPFRKEPTQG